MRVSLALLLISSLSMAASFEDNVFWDDTDPEELAVRRYDGKLCQDKETETRRVSVQCNLTKLSARVPLDRDQDEETCAAIRDASGKVISLSCTCTTALPIQCTLKDDVATDPGVCGERGGMPPLVNVCEESYYVMGSHKWGTRVFKPDSPHFQDWKNTVAQGRKPGGFGVCEVFRAGGALSLAAQTLCEQEPHYKSRAAAEFRMEVSEVPCCRGESIHCSDDKLRRVEKSRTCIQDRDFTFDYLLPRDPRNPGGM